MKKKSISIIVGLMAFALLGVMAMQLYFLRQSYHLKSELFDQSVNQALTSVVDKLEKKDQINFLTDKVRIPEPPPAEEIVKPVRKYQLVRKQEQETEKLGDPEVEIPDPVIPEPPKRWTAAHGGEATVRSGGASVWNKTNPETYAALLKKEQRQVDSIFRIKDSLMRLRYPNAIAFMGPAPTPQEAEENFKLNIRVIQDEAGMHVTQELLRSATPRTGAMVVAPAARVHPIKIDSVRQYVVMDPELGRPVVKIIPKPKVVALSTPPKTTQPSRKQVKLVNRLLDSVEKKEGDFSELVTEFKSAHVSLRKRIEPAVLDSLIRVELSSKGINGSYSYKVTSARHDSVIFTKAADQAEFLPDNTYKTTLFKRDVIRDAGVLTITFPEKNSVIMANLTAMMASSGALLIILVFCFGFTIHSILRQKKISEMKTDFINNMTHEFKTPVSTIMIASDALRDPEITEDKGRISRLAGIIYDENVRLGNHIERVLNVAKIDKGDLKLDLKEVEMNDLIAAVVDSMSLQLQKKDTKVVLNLNALQPVVYGDELHLSNVIFNLIDNANKYSSDDPRIVITTVNEGKNLLIRVADNGIGMSRDQQSKIFDQFYRIPTGNLHDVKGFGLGLSYVSNIVKRLHGTIRVRSEKDKGSEFEIMFPAAC